MSPTPSATWWPSVAPSASRGVISSVAPSSLAVAVTVVESTALPTLAVYASVSAAKLGDSVTPLSDNALSVASADADLVSVTETSESAVQLRPELDQLISGP